MIFKKVKVLRPILFFMISKNRRLRILGKGDKFVIALCVAEASMFDFLADPKGPALYLRFVTDSLTHRITDSLTLEEKCKSYC